MTTSHPVRLFYIFSSSLLLLWMALALTISPRKEPSTSSIFSQSKHPTPSKAPTHRSHELMHRYSLNQ